MNDAVSLLRDRLAKAELKVQRAEKALESARCELVDFQTTLRVMASLMGESGQQPQPPANVTVPSERQAMIATLLSVGRNSAKAPVDIYPIYQQKSGENLTIDSFRTSIWRMTGRPYGVDSRIYVIHREGGAYWLEPAPLVSEDSDSLLLTDTAPERVEPSNGGTVDGSETSSQTLAEEAPEW